MAFRDKVRLTPAGPDNSLNSITPPHQSTVSSLYHLQSEANLSDTRKTISQHPLIAHGICAALIEL